MQTTVQQLSLKNEYDAVNVYIISVHYTQATRSAFAYERPTFDYVIILTSDRL